MSKPIIRHQIADYLKTGETGTGTATPVYSLMGTGFNSLDENPSAKVDTTAYISDKVASSDVTGYETTFPFNTDLIADQDAVMFLYNIGRNQKTGEDAQTEYIRVDLYGTASSGAYPARKFNVTVEVTGITGAGTEKVKVAGNLHQNGDFVEGTFNPTTKVFTPAT